MNVIELFVNDDAVTISDQTMYGDKIVPVRSAALGFMSSATTAYQNADHSGILNTTATSTFISRVIDGDGIDSIEGLFYQNPVTQWEVLQ